MMKHTKKDQANMGKLPMMSQVFGSQAWTEVARVFQILWPINEELKSRLDLADDDQTNVLLFRGKNNYAPADLPSKSFKIDAVELDLDGHHFDEVSKVEFLGESEVTEHEVSEKKSETAKETESRAKNEDKATMWIKDQLSTGPVAQKDMEEKAKRSPHSWMTIRRRKDKMVKDDILKITNVPGTTTNEKQWELTTDVSSLKLVVDNSGTGEPFPF
jgi:hypothetical protein